MVNLFLKVRNTYFHDLYDAILLWMGYEGNEIILKYIQNKKRKELIPLEDMIKTKLNNRD
jgi:hypothetical protein